MLNLNDYANQHLPRLNLQPIHARLSRLGAIIESGNVTTSRANKFHGSIKALLEH